MATNGQRARGVGSDSANGPRARGSGLANGSYARGDGSDSDSITVCVICHVDNDDPVAIQVRAKSDWSFAKILVVAFHGNTWGVRRVSWVKLFHNNVQIPDMKLLVSQTNVQDNDQLEVFFSRGLDEVGE